ncbi:hypothetical protein [Mesorhizobium sp. J18]|uniref:hypothetical protein n=1 Tax=Mesorhizobium sp. J18 TaxID=935263 RepID=UPI0016483DE7|nr:hypothetical protein [Mesorhizobium sp. J18]
MSKKVCIFSAIGAALFVLSACSDQGQDAGTTSSTTTTTEQPATTDPATSEPTTTAPAE